MTLEQLVLLMQTDMGRCLQWCEAHALVKNVYDNVKNIDPRWQYEPYTHDIMDPAKRMDKMVNDEAGNLTGTIKVARLPVPIQKKIVLTAAAFLGVPTLEANDDQQPETDLLTAVQDTWRANKLDYSFKTIAKIVMSEKACAELWFTKDVGEVYGEGYDLDSNLRLSMKILARSRGDEMYPVFDEYDNMIAFGRGYKVLDENAKLVQHFDIYTAEQIYYSKNVNGVWLWGWVGAAGIEYTTDFTSEPNVLGKIPVVYYWQPCTEWQDVQRLIDRYETQLSNLADTNDYFGSPIILASGKVISFSKKGESGKLLEMDSGADVRYLTWDQTPESQKMEIEELKNNIYSYTHTPDITFEKIMGLGYFSTVALKTLFTDAHFKAADKEEIFGMGLQRRINFIKKALTVLDKKLVPGLSLDIRPKFEYYLPKNITEEIDRIVTAVGAGILSKETAVDLNPMVSDADSELQRIKDEAAAAPPAQPAIVKPLIEKAPSQSAANN
jgi:hypothetical protein